MAVITEFAAAVNQICAERGIDPEEVYSALETAILMAYFKDHGEADNIKTEVDRGTGVVQIVAMKEVVKTVKDKDSQISLKQAKEISSNLRIGDSIEMELDSGDMGRIAAQTAKQVILQKVRESEKGAVLANFRDQIGTVVTGIVQRMIGPTAVVEVGKAVACMPPEEQIPNEFYKIGERYKFYVKEIRDESEMIVSRGAPEFLVKLFKLEVPEVESEIVEIMACAREAGSRSKLAVVSHQDGIDPIGSCVGQKGVRIANIMTELGEEKIDIIEWVDQPEGFVANALGPAQVNKVTIDGGTAKVVVPDDQLSLAIGKDGQNVRLAAKLTGKKIDITSPSTKGDRQQDKSGAKSENELSMRVINTLKKAKVSVKSLEKMTEEEISKIKGVGKVSLEEILGYVGKVDSDLKSSDEKKETKR